MHILFIGVIIFPGDTNKMKKMTGRAPPPDVDYTPYNNVPMGATHHKGRLFITMPRRRTGIPSTLNYIDMNKAAGNQSPRLRAYPNLEVNTVNVSICHYDLHGEIIVALSVWSFHCRCAKSVLLIYSTSAKFP